MAVWLVEHMGLVRAAVAPSERVGLSHSLRTNGDANAFKVTQSMGQDDQFWLNKLPD